MILAIEGVDRHAYAIRAVRCSQAGLKPRLTEHPALLRPSALHLLTGMPSISRATTVESLAVWVMFA